MSHPLIIKATVAEFDGDDCIVRVETARINASPAGCGFKFGSIRGTGGRGAYSGDVSPWTIEPGTMTVEY